MNLIDLLGSTSTNVIATIAVLAASLGINVVARNVTHKKTRLVLAQIAELIGQSNICPACGKEKPKCPCQTTQPTGAHDELPVG
jgi:hypothetical protein